MMALNLLMRPLTPTEKKVVDLLFANGELTNREGGEALGMAAVTFKNHVERIAQKIPGRYPAKLRVLLWINGADRETLSPSGKGPRHVASPAVG